MIDLNLIRENPELVKKSLLKRMKEVNFEELLKWDGENRSLITESDKLKQERNRVSAQIPVMKKNNEDTSELFSRMKEVSGKIKELDTKQGELTDKINTFLINLPNIPADDVLPGGKENNKVIKTAGEKPVFDFKAKDHVELVTKLGLIDYERGVKLGGNGFWMYKGKGAVLEWALLNYFIENHLKDGYEFILPPHLLTYACGYTAGQFPKFEDDVFMLENSKEDKQSKHFLLPTAETAIINVHRHEILMEEELPKKYFAYTPCYRREAGSYRTNERGMIRGHQFNKIEMFQFTTPETSNSALDELIQKAEALVADLGLHYQITKLAAEDCSASMAKTFDIEVWIPSMNEYKEVSSISNAHDYQARRGNIRFKRKDSGKNTFIHSLNASGLATSRLLPAICEQFQLKDGSICIPEVLQKAAGTDIIRPD
jgi:seryl-tRNA synthetase